MDCLLALASQLLKDGPARWVGKSPKHVIGVGRCHIKTITIWLLIVKNPLLAIIVATPSFLLKNCPVKRKEIDVLTMVS
jgi:hypothetical protein